MINRRDFIRLGAAGGLGLLIGIPLPGRAACPESCLHPLIRIDRDGRIYVGSQDDHLYCISPAGEILWNRNMGQDIDSSVAFGEDGTLYVGVDDGGVYALR